MKKIAVGIALVLFLGVGVYVGAVFLSGSGGDKQEQTVLIPIEKDIIVNMKDGKSIVKANISLEVLKSLKKEDVEAQTAKIRDLMIGILNSKTAEDYSSDQIKETIKAEFINAVHEKLGLEGIKNIYFNDFVTQ